MKISVIVPVFNEEKTIIELLTKVNKQNTENFSLRSIFLSILMGFIYLYLRKNINNE